MFNIFHILTETNFCFGVCSVSTASIEEGFIPQIPWHAIFVFLDPILLDVMRVEYQNQKKSPFDTHPLQKNIFLITICIYGALIGIKVHTKTRRTSFGEDSQLWSSPFWSVFFTVPSLHLDAATTPVDCAHHMGLHTTNTVSSNAQKCSMLDTKILGEVDMGFFSETFFSMWERYLSKS